MRYAGLLTGFLALTLFVLPGLTAQEKKDDDAKADKGAKVDKKDADKKDPDKKDADKKDPDKKDPDKKDTPKEKKEKEKKPIEEKPEHGAVLKTKIISMKQDSARDFTVEVPMPDQQKIFDLKVWTAQQMQSIAQSPNPQTYAQRMATFQQQMAQKNTYSMKPVEVRAAEKCKVRMMYPPVVYDDAGNLKKWTTKDLAPLKANSKLPGFPADFDLLKTGQWVELYMAKPAAAPKGSATPAPKEKKKKMEDDPDVPMAVPEVVMIVIWAEPMGR